MVGLDQIELGPWDFSVNFFFQVWCGHGSLNLAVSGCITK